jgi:hypothetical protein
LFCQLSFPPVDSWGAGCHCSLPNCDVVPLTCEGSSSLSSRTALNILCGKYSVLMRMEPFIASKILNYAIPFNAFEECTVFIFIFAMKMGAVCSYETLIPTCLTMRCRNPGNYSLNLHHNESFKSC